MNPHLILPSGTQIVSSIEIKTEGDEILCRRDSLGTIINYQNSIFLKHLLKYCDCYG